MNRDNTNNGSNYVFVGGYVANGETDTIRGTRGRETLTLLLDRSGAFVLVLPGCFGLRWPKPSAYKRTFVRSCLSMPKLHMIGEREVTGPREP